MSVSAFISYVRFILSHVPWWHWGVMGGVSMVLTGILLIRKKCSVYGAIALGLTVLLGLFLLDTAVVIRYCGLMHHNYYVDLTLDVSHLFRKSGHAANEILSNFAVFVPFGFFLSEFLAETKRFCAWRRLLLGTLAAFGLSLCIECLQLVLHVGYCVLKDLVMNTMGGFVGASLSAIGRMVFGKRFP